MKLWIWSDLHLEMQGVALPPMAPHGVDAIVCAGDLSYACDLERHAREIVNRYGVPLIFVPGNHEFYSRYSLLRTKPSDHLVMKEAAKASISWRQRLHVLDDCVIEIDGVRFVGGTLWTDFRMDLADEADLPRRMRSAVAQLADFSRIRLGVGERLTPPRILALALGLAALIVLMSQDLSRLGNAPLGAALTLMAAISFGFGTVWLGFMHIPFSIVASILLINAVYLIDGIDGLAGGKSFIALFWMLAACLVAGAGAQALSIGIMMAALAGFLVYNMRSPLRRKASVFLGDAGSMALGLSLAWFGMTLGMGSDPVIAPIAVAWILALPIMDTCAQFARRVAQGRHPFSADRNHFHHHFINAGVSVARATAIITLIGFVLGLIGVGGMLLGVPEYVLAYAWIATILAHIYMSLRPARFRRIVAFFLRRDEAPS